MVARSTDNLDGPGEGPVQPLPPSGGSNVKGKPGKSRISAPRGPFPRLADCAHFHYENVDFGHIQLLLSPDREGANLPGDNELVFGVQVTCQGRSWPVLRSYEDFRSLDGHLHRCIFDGRFSRLPELPPAPEGSRNQLLVPLLLQYLETLSGLVDSNLNCGPVLTWMELDNHGRRLLLSEEASLNIPAVAAAHVVKRYTAQAPDELSFEVGDIVSVIDMPPTEDRSWWRGKHGFQVGFFPSECVELFTERPGLGVKADPDGPTSSIPAPLREGPPSLTSVPRPRGKLAGLLRSFIRSRPSRQRLRQRGILRQRVFGCDLGEHLSNSGQDVPQVLRCCSEFIEAHGIVDGIYRLSGVSSNIQKLRHEFDSERIPELSGPAFLQDIHSVSSLCKLYFRELPNPLLTYQLYGKFSEAMSVPGEEERLVRVHDVIQQLPPPHYRTLEYLLRHLSRMAQHSANTSMHARNLAIVWAPNLLRSMELESVGLGGAAAFREVRVQSVVVEFLLSHVDVLFSDTFASAGLDPAGRCLLSRPKSLVGSGPSTRLLSLEEAQARSQGRLSGQGAKAPTSPEDQRKGVIGEKRRKPGGSSWKTFFALGRGPSAVRKKPLPWRGAGQGSQPPPGGPVEAAPLRSAKSEESLSSQASGAGLQRLHRLRRPRSSSDAFPVVPGLAGSCESLSSTTSSSSSGSTSSVGSGELLGSPPHRVSAWLDDGDDLDFSPPQCLEGLRGLDFDPLTFRCSSPTPGDPAPPASPAPPAPAGSFAHRATPPPRSPRGPASPVPPIALDISEPVAVSVPPAVLELLGGATPNTPSPPPAAPAPHLLPLLLRSVESELSDSCQREIRSKLSLTSQRDLQGSPSPVPGFESPPLPMPLSLLRPGGAPPPPPKNPARLMALALAERAQRAAQRQRQQEMGGTVPPIPRSPFRRSLSLEGGGEAPGAGGPGPLYSMVNASHQAPGPPTSLQRQQSDGGPPRRERRGPAQVPAPFFSSAVTSPSPKERPSAFPKERPSAFPGPPKPPLHSLGTPPFRPGPQPPTRRTPRGPTLLPEKGENLYYEISGGEGPPYSGLSRPWAPFHQAPEGLNASYGIREQSPAQGPPDFLFCYPPPPSHPYPQAVQPFPQHGRLCYHPQESRRRPAHLEPVYVNLPLGGGGPSPTSSSCSSSPPAHPRSRSDPGPPAPRLPHKQRSPWGPRPPRPWGPPDPLLLYRTPTQPYGKGAGEGPHGLQYGNVGDGHGEGAGPPPSYLPPPSWSLHAKGQTHSYC
ncbi:rho GTPase-activating protein 33 isoform X4 [Dromiciops gliroides]|uniref:rho GTPase-activating protein 33 isoform X4 n=1 Tax=Dromiciops gliroides TaxID=33562 RepID=UPI001CC3BBC0|nr:rho GTPase-activating protein 33 isoform X4 [Dromiciops gliroides]